MSVITLMSDFGTGSPYVAALKGVILSINPAGDAGRPHHSIPPQNIRPAALVLDDMAPWFPPARSTWRWSIRAWAPTAAIVYAGSARSSTLPPTTAC